MGRFYSTDKGNYVDFIVEPNYALREKVIDKQVETDYTKNVLLPSVADVTFDYHEEYDAENALKKKQELEEATNAVIDLVKDSPTDRQKYQTQLRELKNRITQEFTSGDIYNMGKSAQNIRKMEQLIAAQQNPATQELYKGYIKSSIEGNPEGSLSKVFEDIPIYDNPALFTEFVNSTFTKMVPSSKSSSGTSIGNRWLVTRNGTTTELSQKEIMDLYQSYVEDHPYAKEMATQRRDVFGQEGWFDESGQLRFDPESELGRSAVLGSQALAYKQTQSQEQVNQNPYNYLRESTNEQIRAYKEKLKADKENAIQEGLQAAGIADVPTAASTLGVFSKTATGRMILKDQRDQLATILSNIADKGQQETLKEIKNLNSSDELTPAQLDLVTDLKKALRESDSDNANILDAQQKLRMLNASFGLELKSGFDQTFGPLTNVAKDDVGKVISLYQKVAPGRLPGTTGYIENDSRRTPGQVITDFDDIGKDAHKLIIDQESVGPGPGGLGTAATMYKVTIKDEELAEKDPIEQKATFLNPVTNQVEFKYDIDALRIGDYNRDAYEVEAVKYYTNETGSFNDIVSTIQTRK